MPRRVAKFVVLASIAAMALSFGVGVSFYYRDLPTYPRPEIGRTVPLDNHGYITYLTRRQDMEQNIAAVLFVVFFVIAAATDYVFDPFNQRASAGLKLTPAWKHRWGPR